MALTGPGRPAPRKLQSVRRSRGFERLLTWKVDLIRSFEMGDLGKLADCLRENRFVEDLSLEFGKPKDNPVLMKEYVDSVLRSPNPSQILRLRVKGTRFSFSCILLTPK
mgnify:CR=1 FL=1